jgi:hypothetical protein
MAWREQVYSWARGEPQALNEPEALLNAAKFAAARSRIHRSHGRLDITHNYMILKIYFLIIFFGNWLLQTSRANR